MNTTERATQLTINRREFLRLSCILGSGIALWQLLDARASYAANPMLHGFADPAMRVWNGRMYLAVGKDKSPTIQGFAMPYWAIFSSEDLVNWRQEKIIDPSLVSYMGKDTLRCWATDIAFRNDKFYFYFSDGGMSTGVLVANKPDGKYTDVLKKPLVAPENNHENFYDPTVFTDTDGASYLIYGRDGHLLGETANRHYQIAKLNPDMISFAEKPRDLLTDELYGFGDATQARDHNYFHKYNNTYYLSCDRNYMTSKSVYGPFSNLRSTGGTNGHSCYISFHGQWYHSWEFTDDQHDIRTYRQVMMTYLHYKNNGDMVDDQFFMEGGPGFSYGVGNYNAEWDAIQAEWFFAISGAVKKDSPSGGFEIQEITNRGYLKFPQVKNLMANSSLSFRISSANPNGGKIHIHEGHPSGPLLGTCDVPCTQGWDKYQLVSCNLKNGAGTVDLCLVFEGGPGDLMHLDWLTFHQPKIGFASEALRM